MVSPPRLRCLRLSSEQAGALRRRPTSGGQVLQLLQPRAHAWAAVVAVCNKIDSDPLLCCFVWQFLRVEPDLAHSYTYKRVLDPHVYEPELCQECEHYLKIDRAIGLCDGSCCDAQLEACLEDWTWEKIIPT